MLKIVMIRSTYNIIVPPLLLISICFSFSDCRLQANEHISHLAGCRAISLVSFLFVAHAQWHSSRRIQ